MAFTPLVISANHFNACYKQRNLPALIALTDAQRLPEIQHVIPHMPRNSLIIVRDYDIADREAYVKNILSLARPKGIKVVVGRDEPMAIRCNADGVHFPEVFYQNALACKRRHPHWIVTGAVHSLRAIKRVEHSAIDLLLLSPVFPTLSHVKAIPLGPRIFRILCKKTALPLYPLGGINDITIAYLKLSRTPGVAAIGAFGDIYATNY